MTAQERDLLHRGLHQLSMGDRSLEERLLAYADLLCHYNPRYRLVADTTRLVTHHLLDSLVAASVVDDLGKSARILDVGSGAGLPGIPLALALLQSRVTLLERSARRAKFLTLACGELQLHRCTVVQGALEQISGGRAAEPHDVVVFRAVAATPVVVAALRALAARGMAMLPSTTLIAYKGTLPRLREELRGLDQPHDLRRVEVPFLGETRHLVLVKGPWPGTAAPHIV